MSNNEDNSWGIGLKEVKYIGSLGKCPACGSKSVKFSLPFESHLLTEDGKISKVVLDFRNPQYWLKTTTTKCANCSFEFHLRDVNDNFYKGLAEAKESEPGDDPRIWSYEFEVLKPEE